MSPEYDEYGRPKHQLDVKAIMDAVHEDPHINHEEKAGIMGYLNDPDALAMILGGTAGAALTHTITQYMKLDRTSQILLSLAGFGLGSILVKTIGADQSHLADYNAQRGYKIHTQ